MIGEREKDEIVGAIRETAAREIMPLFRNLDPDDIDTKSGATDLVTQADRATETALRAAMRRILPGSAFIGEEAGADDPGLLDAIGTAERCVIVDPIDGTGNFASGLAVFGVILAVVEAGKTVLSVLYDPVMDDWAIAEAGAGAWMAGPEGSHRRLRTRDVRPLDQARGLVPLENCSPSERADMLRRFDGTLQVHDLRCSCHDYRALAAGQADYIVALMLNPWDHAAGQLLAREAGGWSRVAGDLPYAPTLTDGRMVTASCADVGERIISRLS